MLIKAAFISSKYSKNRNIVKKYYNWKYIKNIYFEMNCIPLTMKLNFQKPLLQSYEQFFINILN